MQIGLGLDFALGLRFEDQATLAREAAEIGYEQRAPRPRAPLFRRPRPPGSREQPRRPAGG